MSRRRFLAAGSAAFLGHPLAANPPNKARPMGIPMYQEDLPFDLDKLQPNLDVTTLKLHRAHHQWHFVQLRRTLEQANLHVGNLANLMPRLQSLPRLADHRTSVVQLGAHAEKLPKETELALRYHGGAHVNHTIFWRGLRPPNESADQPSGVVAQAIKRDFGSVDDFKKIFTQAALSLFGSGWVWLVYRPDRCLVVTTTQNEDNPLMQESIPPQDFGRPILALDVWEHAYYPQYQQNRRQYVEAWWHLVNWDFVARAYAIVTAMNRR